MVSIAATGGTAAGAALLVDAVRNTMDLPSNHRSADAIDAAVPLPDHDAAEAGVVPKLQARRARYRCALPVHLVRGNGDRERRLPVADRAQLSDRLRREAGQREHE